MMKTTIKAQSLPWQKPYKNLTPIVEVLIKGGNTISSTFGNHKPNRDGFYMDRDGWVCDLERPIDFDVIEKRFNIPPSIRLNKTENTVLFEPIRDKLYLSLTAEPLKLHARP
jgi:hypothetical protein